MKQIYEMNGRGHSARAIARELGLAHNTLLRYLNSRMQSSHGETSAGIQTGPLHDHMTGVSPRAWRIAGF